MNTYKSKVSWGLVFFLCLLFGVIGYMMIRDFVNVFSIASFLLVVLFVFYVIFSVRYTVYDKDLLIQIGFVFRQNIEICSIRRIVSTHSILSSPAASFDRIEIYYGRFDSVIISPENRQKFLDHLLKINPDIELHL